MNYIDELHRSSARQAVNVTDLTVVSLDHSCGWADDVVLIN
jgi:hypothetical protein